MTKAEFNIKLVELISAAQQDNQNRPNDCQPGDMMVMLEGAKLDVYMAVREQTLRTRVVAANDVAPGFNPKIMPSR